ncbi:MAG: glycoside hydrolase domain-containing protein [Candidatus Omnitrophota bacterium]
MNRKTWMIFAVGLAAGAAGTSFIAKSGKLTAAKSEIPAKIEASAHPSPMAARSSFNKDEGIFSNFDGKDPVGWGGVKTEIVDCDFFVTKSEEGKAESEGSTAIEDRSAPAASRSSAQDFCLKTTYPRGDFPGLSAKNLPGDWTGFNMLVFDVFNPSEEPVKFGILIKDEPGGHGYNNRYDGEFAFRPGRGKFIFNVTGLKTNDGKRLMDISQVKELVIFLVRTGEPTTLYFDNIRLEKAPGSEITGMERFDFGTQQSEVWPGFIQVTDQTRYQPDPGYGWENTSELTAQDRQYPDALFRDWVRGQGPFKVDVDNGRYVVYVMLEDPGFWEYYQNYPERKFFAEGRLVGHEQLPPEIFLRDYYFAHLNHEDLPGADVFRDYVQKRFVWRRFEVDVEDGQLSLRFEGPAYANTLSALIVAPKEAEDEVRGYLKDLDEQRREYFSGAYVERIPNFPAVPDEIVEQFGQLGFIPFAKHYLEPMFPAETPRPHQMLREISIFAAPGESEPFVIGFYPFKDLGRYHTAVSALTSEQGALIPAEQIRIRSVQYKLKLASPRLYNVRGELLRNTNITDLRKGVTRFMWFTVNVPKETAPGVYHGYVAVKNESSYENALLIPLKVEVMPFTLEPLDIAVGMFYNIPPQFDWYEELEDQKWTAVEFQLKDIRDHGMNTLAMSLSPGVKQVYDNGDVELDFKFFDTFMHTYRHFGFNQPVSGYGMINVFHDIRKKTGDSPILFDKAIVSAFKQISGHARHLAGQDIIIGIADEISNVGGEGVESIMGVARVLKEAGINATGFFNNEKDRPVFPYLKTVTVNNGVRIDEGLLKEIGRAGNDLWFYNIGQDRFSFGYYLWRTGAKGRVQWHYQLPAVDPFFDLDGREGDYCASYPSPFGPINATWFEMASEGIDDYRYLITLERKIEERKAKGEKQTGIENAQRLLEAFRNDINVKIRENRWFPVEYDARRADVARAIQQLLATGD